MSASGIYKPAPIGSSQGPDGPVAAEVSPSIWRHIRRDAVVLGAGNIGAVVAQLIFRSILVAALLPVDYGRLSLVLGIYNTIWIVGASGLPSATARYISAIAPADDYPIIRSAVRAGAWPIIIAATIVAAMSGIFLHSFLASVFAAVGIIGLVYSLLTMGILRGRGRMGSAASILPIAAIGEAAPLAIVWSVGLTITPLLAFGIFCFGNIVGFVAGSILTVRTAPQRAPDDEPPKHPTPSPRKLLSLSLWLGAATIGVAILPLVIRWAAVLDSYTTVAVIDVSLILLAVPQRIGTVVLFAVVPHATRALGNEKKTLTISSRETVLTTFPFALVAVLIAFTPVVGWFFDLLGRPVYGKSADYLALALLAGPARILYGVVEGVLIAHAQGRILARNALSVTVIASIMIVASSALGNTIIAFVIFVIAFWAIYLLGLMQVKRLAGGSAEFEL
jgi:O-antigen/teichoic acid export membrane protein